MSIDFQAHVFPREYVDILTQVSGFPQGRLQEGKLVVDYGHGMADQRYKILSKLQDLDERLDHMDSLGIQTQVLTVAIPGSNAGTSSESLRMSRAVNDFISNAVKKYKGRFLGFASLPLLDQNDALAELDRAVNSLELVGVEIYSNARGRSIDDRMFWKIYEKMEDYGIGLYIHPTTPYMAKEELLKDYYLWGPAFGYTFDTALAVLRFINSGVMEEFKKLKVMIGHLGETLPYIIDRIDWAYTRFPDTAVNLKRTPHEYLLDMFVDTAGIFSGPSLECATKVLSHDKLVFGSDYPFENIEKAVSFVRDSDVSESIKKKILSENGRAFFGK